MSNDIIYQCVNGEMAALSGDELAEYLAQVSAWQSDAHARLCADVRRLRDSLLLDSDVTVLRALETDADISPLRSYRQALRDIPTQPGFPDTVIWPQHPAA